MSKSQRLNRAAVLFWVTAVLLFMDGFAFKTGFPILVGVVLVFAGAWFTNKAESS